LSKGNDRRLARPRSRPLDITPADIERALDEQEFVVFLQPKAQLSTGCVTAAEALVRWRHPRHGTLSPVHFLPLIEAVPAFSAEMTAQVIASAVRARRLLKDKGHALRLAINISMTDLAQRDLPDSVERMVGDAGLAVADFTFEVTESRMTEEVVAPLEVLNRLALKGFELSIDDYGTGHSSMARLLRVPFIELKLDQSFLRRASEDRRNLIVLKHTIAMAHELGMRVVAEGVETPRDWHLIKQVGCDIAQGYLLSMPLPPDALARWLGDWNDKVSQIGLFEAAYAPDQR
jgi:EAL domain-containing protein (putative c-di-GMP-specific phosphodiesterase class I)